MAGESRIVSLKIAFPTSTRFQDPIMVICHLEISKLYKRRYTMMSSWKQKASNTRVQDENENMLRTGFTQVWGYNETTVTAVHCPWLGNSGRKTMASWFIHPKAS